MTSLAGLTSAVPSFCAFVSFQHETIPLLGRVSTFCISTLFSLMSGNHETFRVATIRTLVISAHARKLGHCCTPSDFSQARSEHCNPCWEETCTQNYRTCDKTSGNLPTSSDLNWRMISANSLFPAITATWKASWLAKFWMVLSAPRNSRTLAQDSWKQRTVTFYTREASKIPVINWWEQEYPPLHLSLK